MRRMRSLLIPGVDKKLLVRDAVKTDAGSDAPAFHLPAAPASAR